MDYTHAAYFSGGHQPYHFIPMPPLTPSHSTSGPSEDFNTTSPPEMFGDYPGEQFANFDAGFTASAPFGHQQTQQQQQHPQRNAFSGRLTPPNTVGGPQIDPRPAPTGALNGAIAHPPHVVQSQPQHGPNNVNAAAAASSLLAPKNEILLEDPQSRRGGSNSEEDDLTPAQSKRKAQNRAAQRAFRERKERHVKELEAKLATLQAAQEAAATENERLKRDLQKVSTENEILRATGGAGSPGSSHTGTTTGPMTYNPTNFYSNLLEPHANKAPSHRITMSDDGEQLYAAGATWDFIVNHELFKRGLVDIAEISDRLKYRAKCDGQGPVFEESVILEAIEQSVASGSDTLL